MNIFDTFDKARYSSAGWWLRDTFEQGIIGVALLFILLAFVVTLPIAVLILLLGLAVRGIDRLLTRIGR